MQRIKKCFNSYRSMPVQAKASIWYTVCNLFQRGISFLVVPIYVRLLTTAEYGAYSVFQSWRDIIIIIATLNLYCGIYTKAMVDLPDESTRAQYTASMQGLGTVITGLVFLLYMFFSDFWNQLLNMNTITVLLLFLYFLTYPALQFWYTHQRVLYQYRSMVFVTVAVCIATPLISIVLLFSSALRELALIWGCLISQIAAGSFFYVYHYIRGKKFFHVDYWNNALRFNIPLIPHYLSLIVLGQADRIMIEHYCGSDDAGIYNLAYQVALFLNVVIAAINGSLVPWLYNTLKEQSYLKIRKCCNVLCYCMVSATFAFALIAPELIAILGTAAYREAIYVVPAVASSVYFTFCYGLFSAVEFYYSATKYVMVASVSGGLLNILLNAIFIPQYGFIAAGYTTAVCYFILMLMHYVFTRMVYHKEEIVESPFNSSVIFGSSVLLGFLSVSCIALYEQILIRYSIVLIAFLIAIWKRNDLKNLYQNTFKH